MFPYKIEALNLLTASFETHTDWKLLAILLRILIPCFSSWCSELFLVSASICTGKRDALNIWVNLLTAVRQRRSHLEVQLLKTTQQHLHLNSFLLSSQLNPTSDVFPDHSKLC